MIEAAALLIPVFSLSLPFRPYNPGNVCRLVDIDGERELVFCFLIADIL
ncbi:hypothetical protein RAC65_08765 [Pantoea sp. BS_8]